MEKLVRFICYSIVSAALLATGAVLTFTQPQVKQTSKFYSDTYSISYSVNQDGSVNVREMFSVINKEEKLDELYLPINYKKDNSLSSADDVIKFDYSSFNIILNSTGQEYYLNLQEKGYDSGYLSLSCSWVAEHDLDIRNEEIKAEKNTSMAYLYCYGGFPENFSILITYKLENFVTVFNDYAYLETSGHAFTYPYSKFQFTVALPGSGDDVTIDDIKMNTTSKFKSFVQHPSKSGFIVEGEKTMKEEFSSRVVFPSSLMNKAEDFEEPQSNYQNKEITNAIYKKTEYKSNFSIDQKTLLYISVVGLALAAIVLVVVSLFSKRDKTINYSSKASPVYYFYERSSKELFVKDVVNYYVFEEKLLVPYLIGDKLYLKKNKDIEPKDDVEKYVISSMNSSSEYDELVDTLCKNSHKINSLRKKGLKDSKNNSIHLNFKFVDLYFFVPAIIYLCIAIATIFFTTPLVYFGLFAISIMLFYMSHIDEIFLFLPVYPGGNFAASRKRINELLQLEHSKIPEFREIEGLFIGSHMGRFGTSLYTFISKNNKDNEYLKNSSSINNQKIIKKLLS